MLVSAFLREDVVVRSRWPHTCLGHASFLRCANYSASEVLQQKAGAAGVHWWPVVAYTRWAARGCHNAPRASTYQLWSWGLLWLKPRGLSQVFAGPRVRRLGSSVGLGSRRATGVSVAGRAGVLQLKGA